MGTTITIGIVHDDGITADRQLGRRLDEAVGAVLSGIGVPEPDVMPHVASLERDDTTLIYTITWGEHVDDVEPEPPALGERLRTLFDDFFDGLAARTFQPAAPEPEPEPEPAVESLVVEIDGVGLVVGQRWQPAEAASNGQYPVRIVGLAALPNDDGEVDPASSAVFYRFASQADSTRPYRTTVLAFLAAYPVQVKP
jgi:hypothetical protein